MYISVQSPHSFKNSVQPSVQRPEVSNYYGKLIRLKNERTFDKAKRVNHGWPTHLRPPTEGRRHEQLNSAIDLDGIITFVYKVTQNVPRITLTFTQNYATIDPRRIK